MLEAYLDRTDPEWREQEGAPAGTATASTGSTAITRDEAYEILGLIPGASEKKSARPTESLMKSFHPDQGGSSYLASKINQAKDLLLGVGRSG